MAKKLDKITYYPQAKVKCLNCGSEYTVGMTLETLNLEICGTCHPFYTGQETLVDTAGRIEKFQNRVNKTTGSVSTKKAKLRKIRTSDIEINFGENAPEETVETPVIKESVAN
ncbi:MAG: 50S ribosomal protein L31 [Candidatus Parcubacteria bacterium]|nr:50S ribosomal protein L31 [Candidatus Paceibacterota bacterium]